MGQGSRCVPLLRPPAGGGTEGAAPRHGTAARGVSNAPRLRAGAASGVTPSVSPSAGRDQSGVTELLAVPAVLPESRHLCFDCGVTVQLGFAAEFSNIMIIYTRILAAPGDITECVAKLTDLPEVGWHPQRGSTWGGGLPRCLPLT